MSRTPDRRPSRAAPAAPQSSRGAGGRPRPGRAARGRRRNYRGAYTAEGLTFLLVASIGMFFCCPLVAIFSTVYSVAAVNAMGRGDSALAASKASVAKICVIVVSVLWALLIAAYLYMLKTGRIPAE